MAVDKLVDSTQLDADLTSVANAIRAKGGTSADLAFPAGFVQAIGDISGGGADPLQYATRIQYTWSDMRSGPDDLILNLQNVTAFTYGAAEGWQPIRLFLNLSQEGVCTSMLGACRWMFTSIGVDNRMRYIKITGDLSNVTTYQNCFSSISNENYLEIDADIDFTSATNVAGMFNQCWDITSIRFVRDSLKISLNMGSSRSLNNAALCSIANGLNPTVSGESLTLNNVSKQKCTEIIGTVTDGLFVEDSQGNISLSDFITSVKGWTLA